MPLPPNFSSWRHFHGVLVRTHNPTVQAFFSKLESDLGRGDSGKKKAIQQIRTACTIRVNDSAIVASGKVALFNSYAIAKSVGVEGDFYAMPIEDYHERVRLKPQVVLLFRQPRDEVPDGRRAIEAQIGFRWRKESPSKGDAASLANRIDSEFGWRDRPYKWERGAVIGSYVDPDRGYRLKLYVKNQSEGREVIEKVLNLQNDSFDRNFYSYSKTERQLRDGTERQTILGESRKLPRERPSGRVAFYRAELKVWGVRPDVTLVDYSGRRKDLLD